MRLAVIQGAETMKTITKKGKDVKIVYSGTCPVCLTEFNCEESDLRLRVMSLRFPSAHAVTDCPKCKFPNVQVSMETHIIIKKP